MIKRVALAVISVAAGALALAAPASFAAAAQASTTSSAAPAVDWGPNHDGWHVHLTNDTRFVAQNISVPFDNVFHAPAQIQPGATARDIRGVKSAFGGPANMHVTYKLSGSQDSSGIPVEVIVYVRSDAFGGVSATCKVQRPLKLQPKGYHCSVGPAVSNKPITARVYTSAP